MLRGVTGGNSPEMADSAAKLVPPRPSLPKLRAAAAGCRACPLWEDATQTVFGAGSRNSVAMFVGEQPGDREDRKGAPFVGPAGRLLDEALERAGIDRRSTYVTNAVKHFKWEPRGKRRIHAKPTWSELRFQPGPAGGEWLESDLAEHVTATIHPSAILRQRDDESRRSEMEKFVEDLKIVASVL